LIMAKGIASGMPLSGIMARRELLEKFGPGAHGGTYGGNAVACAAALATLDVIAAEGLLENARRQGERLLSNLLRITADHSSVAEVRGRGLMLAVEFADADGLTPRPDLVKAFIQAAFERKLLLLSCGTYGQVVRIIPPLVTNDTEVDSAISAMSEALAAIGA
ncbi:MAG TPA: aminotransferase class III-fold pyridoxal phosphate-dependent enzyme, partial [Candidatus Limnocylindria bacterium]